MQKIHRAEAERMLGVSSSTMYNRANKLGIGFINEITSVGKCSYVRWEDLEKMAKAMGKPLAPAGE